MSLIIPGHLVFFFIIYAVKPEINLSAQFVIFYILVGVVQVTVFCIHNLNERALLTFLFRFKVTFLMVMCYTIVHTIWRLNQNPDNMCIPLLTATGDLLGVGLLYFCFFLTEATGDPTVRLGAEEAATNSTMLLTSSTLSLLRA